MSRSFIDYIITKLTQHRGFKEWIQFLSSVETRHQIEEYLLFSKAHDEPVTLEGFATYLGVSLRGGK